MRTIAALLIVFSFSGKISLGQKISFFPGYYITHKGDTINGFGRIESTNKIQHFDFKSDQDSTSFKTIAALDCKEVAFGKEVYVTWYGKRHLSYVNGNDLYRVEHIGETVTDSICIRLAYQGKDFALYHFKGEKNHFFVKAHNRIDELILSYDYFPQGYRLAANNYQKSQYLIHKTYQPQIFSVLNNKFKSQRQVDLLYSTEYDRHSLVRLFKSLDK